jgi:hypothetical protein
MLYHERGTDSISNLYQIKLVNKTTGNIPLSLRLEDVPGRVELLGHQQIQVKGEQQGEGIFFVVLPRTAIKKRKTTLHITLYADDKKTGTISTTFLGPAQ